MPPVVPYRIPDWANPANASVLDSWAQKAIRTLGGLAGMADPVSQVMGLAAAPIDVPAANLAEGLGAKTLKAYHGTAANFDQFTDPAAGKAVWFTKDPSDAARYSEIAARGGGAPKVLAADVTLKKDGAERLKELGHLSMADALEQLKREGYDGFTDGNAVAVFQGGQAQIRPTLNKNGNVESSVAP